MLTPSEKLIMVRTLGRKEIFVNSLKYVIKETTDAAILSGGEGKDQVESM